MNILAKHTDSEQSDLFPPEYNLPTSDKLLRSAIFEVFWGKCFYTWRNLAADNFHIDHVIPKSKWWPDNIYNYVLCSPDINVIKKDSFDEIWAHQALTIVRQVYASRVLKEYERLKWIEQKKSRTVLSQQEITIKKAQEILAKRNKAEEEWKKMLEFLQKIESGISYAELVKWENWRQRRKIRIFFKDWIDLSVEEIRDLFKLWKCYDKDIFFSNYHEDSDFYSMWIISCWWSQIDRRTKSMTFFIVSEELLDNLTPSWQEIETFLRTQLPLDDLEEVKH